MDASPDEDARTGAAGAGPAEGQPAGAGPVRGGASGGAAGAQAVDATIDAAGVLLRVAARSVQHVEDIVTSPQLRVLMLIELSGPQTLGGVAAELGVHASNATRTCEKLVQARLITRREDPADRRFVRLELTRKGRQLVERVIAERREAMAVILHKLPAPDRDTVAQGFRLFAEAAAMEPTRDGRFTLGPTGAGA